MSSPVLTRPSNTWALAGSSISVAWRKKKTDFIDVGSDYDAMMDELNMHSVNIHLENQQDDKDGIKVNDACADAAHQLK